MKIRLDPGHRRGEPVHDPHLLQPDLLLPALFSRHFPLSVSSPLGQLVLNIVVKKICQIKRTQLLNTKNLDILYEIKG